MRPPRAPLALALVWLLGAAVATSVGLLAVRLVATQVGDPAVPAVSVVRPPQQPMTAPTPRTAATAAPPAAATATRTFSSAGGRVGVQCRGSEIALLLATPANGYALDEQGISGGVIEVRFEGVGTRVRLDLACRSGRPALLEERLDEDRSGKDGD